MRYPPQPSCEPYKLCQVSVTLRLSPGPVTEGGVPPPAGWFGWAVIKGLGCPRQNHRGALHHLVGAAFLSAVHHQSTTIPWKTQFNVFLEFDNAICLSEELISMPGLSYMNELCI